MGNRESLQRPHEELEVWRDAMDFVEAVYRFSALFPADERYGLTAHARASLAETDTQIKIAGRLRFAEEPGDLRELIDRLSAKLTALLAKLDEAERSLL